MEQQKFTLRVNIQIEQGPFGRDGRLQIQEEVTIPAKDFLECAKILGVFHDLVEKMGGGK